MTEPTNLDALKREYAAARVRFDAWGADETKNHSWENYAAMQAQILDAGSMLIAALEQRVRQLEAERDELGI